jgi:hypothetical protein
MGYMCILQLKASRFSLFCAMPNNRRWVGNIQRGGFAAPVSLLNSF